MLLKKETANSIRWYIKIEHKDVKFSSPMLSVFIFFSYAMREIWDLKNIFNVAQKKSSSSVDYAEKQIFSHANITERTNSQISALYIRVEYFSRIFFYMW